MRDGELTAHVVTVSVAKRPREFPPRQKKKRAASPTTIATSGTSGMACDRLLLEKVLPLCTEFNQASLSFRFFTSFSRVKPSFIHLQFNKMNTITKGRFCRCFRRLFLFLLLWNRLLFISTNQMVLDAASDSN